MFNTRTKSKSTLQRPIPLQQAVLSRQHSVPLRASTSNIAGSLSGLHPYTLPDENTRLHHYECQVKGAFSCIEAVLQEISAIQHGENFVANAQKLAKASLGFDLPEHLLADSWIKSLDIGQLYSWCVFETFRQMSDDFFSKNPLDTHNDETFQSFLEECGFHTMDISPCADGRLAHVIRYVLRLPHKVVRRKSYAGAMFDIDDSLQRWVKTEMRRYREGVPNAADAPTRYLKVAAYHFSSSQPDQEGCAAHGSNVELAAKGALGRLKDFRQGVENSFCCGASIDLLLIGIDTDTDIVRLHLPNADGDIDANGYIDSADLYQATRSSSASSALTTIRSYLEAHCEDRGASLPTEGMLKLASYVLRRNLSQIDYVRQYHQGCYSDIGHNECFIGMGIGFEEVQLRNLTYFAYLQTVEEGTKDIDVGIKIFTGLNVNRGLPIPIVIRNDYHSKVPSARERAKARCEQIEAALRNRYSDYAERGLLHTLLMVRDCSSNGRTEMVGCSLMPANQETH